MKKEQFQTLIKNTRELFDQNKAKFGDYQYTRPSSQTYQSQFAWDSGFHSIAAKYFNKKLAKEELLSLFSFQQINGRIPHEIIMPNHKKQPIHRSLVHFFLRHSFNKNLSYFIDPPCYVYAAWDVYQSTLDKKFLQQIYPKLSKLLDYLAIRDAFGDGMVSIVHPLESGTDDSPAFDQYYNENTRWFDPLRRFQKSVRLVKVNAKNHWNFTLIKKEGDFLFEDLLFNVFYLKAMECLSLMAGKLGKADEEKEWQTKYKKQLKRFEKVYWDEDKGLFLPRFNPSSPTYDQAVTLSCVSPIFLNQLDKNKIDKMVQTYITHPDHFWTPFKLSFNSIKNHSDCYWNINQRLLWRGPVVWINMNWLITLGLINYGYLKQAKKITRETVQIIQKNGFYEYYDAISGKGKGAPNFTWGALVLDMIHRCNLV